jgi:hypothetical protein
MAPSHEDADFAVVARTGEFTPLTVAAKAFVRVRLAVDGGWQWQWGSFVIEPRFVRDFVSYLTLVEGFRVFDAETGNQWGGGKPLVRTSRRSPCWRVRTILLRAWATWFAK